jgi:hypothetical protein
MGIQKCPSCGERKPKRSCPALGRTICTVCCATKREVEIACPADCVYLSSARSHPPAVVQRRQERDLSFVVPLVSDLTEAQYRLLVLLQSVTLKHAHAAMPPLVDEDVAEAASAAAATLETAGKGIIYQHQAVSVPAQRLSSELSQVVAELVSQSGAQRGRLERDAAAALRRLERGARTAAQGLNGDEPPVFLRLLTRMLRERTDKDRTGEAADSPGGAASSGLIIQP